MGLNGGGGCEAAAAQKQDWLGLDHPWEWEATTGAECRRPLKKRGEREVVPRGGHGITRLFFLCLKVESVEHVQLLTGRNQQWGGG